MIQMLLPQAIGSYELNMVQLLIDYGANIKALVVTNNIYGYNALLTMADNGFVDKLTCKKVR